jgi:hypothetical protein
MTRRHFPAQRKMQLLRLESVQGLNEDMIADALTLKETVYKPPQPTLFYLFELYLTTESTV